MEEFLAFFLFFYYVRLQVMKLKDEKRKERGERIRMKNWG